MVGRTFLTASFGVLMTTWTVPATMDSNMSKIAPENVLIPNTNEILTQATPLYWSKDAIKKDLGADYYGEVLFKATVTGETGGCLGETSVLVLLAGGIYLLIRKTISFHIPLAVILSAFTFATIAFFKDSFTYIPPWLHISSGGLLLCAFFIATDPVTAPLTRRGMWIFGIGVGGITMLIRIAGVYPEGVMFSILLMNAVTPLIDRFIKKIPAGGEPGA
jgi:Na+-translocating ferredoxin:NAD+ oxidoreductase subunit D